MGRHDDYGWNSARRQRVRRFRIANFQTFRCHCAIRLDESKQNEPENSPSEFRRKVKCIGCSAAKRRQNVATAEGGGKDLSRKARPGRGERLSGLEESFAPAGALFCRKRNHGLQPWLYSDAAPRLLSSHPDFIEIFCPKICPG